MHEVPSHSGRHCVCLGCHQPRGTLAAATRALTHRLGCEVIGGKLDMAAMGRLHFTVLTRDQQAQAIRRLASSGMSEYGISHATGLAVEMIRRIIAEAA